MPPGTDTLPVIPLPARVEPQAGTFTLGSDTAITADDANGANAAYLHDLLAPPTGFPLVVQAHPSPQASLIRLRIGKDPGVKGSRTRNSEIFGPEGYALTVSPQAVTIEAPSPAGVFYGIQTLRQLLPPEIETRGPVAGVAWQVPCVVVQDAPRFRWRGYMLDEARHFHGKETVLRTLDVMALQKLNIFHWHLTEDQGWRIEIKRYPRLTEIGSIREGTAQRRFTRKHNGIPHSGFYTQDEIREIVAYAAQRNITVVPEIEIPGHSLAALAAYPELSCTGGPFQVDTGFGITRDIYCAGKEPVFAFLQDVLDEIVSLFPSPYIHIGGDETPKTRWKACPDCQRRIQQEGLADEHELQAYVTNRIAAHLAFHGRRAVVWNDALHPELAESAIIQYWVRNRKGVIEALRAGRDAVLSPFGRTYLDYSYSLTPLSKAYGLEPVFSGLDRSDEPHVLGPEAPLWTEWVENRARLDYQTYPRLIAIAETGWSGKDRKDYGGFRARLEPFLERLDRLGIGYAPSHEWESSRLAQLFGIFTILRPESKTA